MSFTPIPTLALVPPPSELVGSYKSDVWPLSIFNLSKLHPHIHTMSDHDRGATASDLISRHLDWSDKQRRILTANHQADYFYTKARGYDYDETELPHYHLSRRDTRTAFPLWRLTLGRAPSCSIVGAWRRPLFYGGWEHSTDRDETVYNIQTNTLFVDLRIPVTRDALFGRNTPNTSSTIEGVDDLTKEQLQWFARQHVFAGFSVIVPSSSSNEDGSKKRKGMVTYDACCTRHHCLDWNFVGVGRTRPNKWWIELQQPHSFNHTESKGNGATTRAWKEWAYATDEGGQHYYCERWERCADTRGNENQEFIPVVALRRCGEEGSLDGIIVIVGDHFNYCLGTCDVSILNSDSDQDGYLPSSTNAGGEAASTTTTPTSLIGMVDTALDRDDLAMARMWLRRISGGHGLISLGWKIDCAIEFWKEGSSLWKKEDIYVSVSSPSVEDETSVQFNSWKVVWNNVEWEVFESNLDNVTSLESLLHRGL